MVGVLVLAIASVTLLVFGPKVLGHATNLIVDGVIERQGHRLHRRCTGRCSPRSASTSASSILSYWQAYLLAGVVQRSMFRLRSDVEDKLNRLPLRYVDRQPRGDMLSRVTNDIDNLPQSLQQTMSQLLTSTLTIVGVLIMMFTISPPLALDRAHHRPGLDLHASGWSRSDRRSEFIDQWRHTGIAERAGGGGVHRALAREGLRPSARRRADVQRQERRAVRCRYAAQFISGTIQPAMMFLGNLNYVVIALDRRPAGRVGPDVASATSRRSSSTPASSRSRSPSSRR